MPFSTENNRKIMANRPSIVKGLKLDNILDELISKFILKPDDEQRINFQTTQEDKNREFVKLLVQAPARGYKIFIDALKDDDSYIDLAQEIENTEVPEDPEEIEKPKTVEDWIGEGLLTSERGQHYLKDLDLMRYSRAIKPLNIIFVATGLGISAVDVQNIEYKHNRSPESMCHELLIKWRNKTGHSATVRSLLEKLFLASEFIYVETIRDILKEQNT